MKIIFDNKGNHEISKLTPGNIYEVILEMDRGSLVENDNGSITYIEKKYQKKIDVKRKELIDSILKKIRNNG
jgi:hypothetical protein